MDSKASEQMLDELFDFILKVKDEETLKKTLGALMSKTEAITIAQRYKAARMLQEDYPYSEIVRRTDVSPFVISKISRSIQENDIKIPDTVSSYKSFALVYDRLTQDVEYEKRFEYIESIFKKFKAKPSLVLDLGCGTGGMTTIMAEHGYDMIGVDISADMLDVAQQKSEDLKILYLNQPMQELDLYGTVDAAISLLDSINYLEDTDELEETFKRVENFLNPGGLFIFDINTKYKLENILAGNIFCGEDEDVYYTWENYYDKEEKLCEFKLEFFITENGSINRYTEYHYEKAFELTEIKNALKKSGFELLAVYDDLSFEPNRRNSEKIFFVAKKKEL